MRKQHNFKAGDKLVRNHDGLTCTVERIDPACNNVYAKDFSNGRRDGEELSSPYMWTIDESASVTIKSASELAPTSEAFEITVLKLNVGDALSTPGFSSSFVQRETVDKSGEGLSYRNQVQTYLEDIAGDLTVPGEYLAVAIYGDGDTITRKFTVKPLPMKPPVEVTFA